MMILYHIHEKQSNIPFLSFFNCWLERKNTTLLQKEQEKKDRVIRKVYPGMGRAVLCVSAFSWEGIATDYTDTFSFLQVHLYVVSTVSHVYNARSR